MSKYEVENKPLVSILMAVYKPNVVWLIAQLQSLNDQDYENLELIIWDDCPECPVDEELFTKFITNISYTLIRGERNLGSNGAFEALTKRATGSYISYCDQDDIWNQNKVSKMLEVLLGTEAALVCCEQYIIDENSVKIADSITEVRKRHTWRTGSGLAKYLIADNFVTGCALMMRTDIAKKAVPFEPLLVHDQWLGIVAAMHGNIEVITEPLIGYRQHSSNQTGILLGVEDKQTYYQWRIEYFLQRATAIRVRLEEMGSDNVLVTQDIKSATKEYEEWMLVRKQFFERPTVRGYKQLRDGKKFSKSSVMLESVLPIIPNVIFKQLIRLAKKGVL